MSEPPVHTSGDEVHAHPHKTGHRLVDTIVAISAITISVISLFVAIEHGKTEEKLVAANSWPFLVFNPQKMGSTSALVYWRSGFRIAEWVRPGYSL